MIDHAARRARLQERLARDRSDVLAICPGEHMTYLLGFHPHPDERPCFLLLTPTDAAMLMPALNAEEARQHTSLPMETYDDAEGPAGALDRLTQRLRLEGVRRVALDETMRTDFTLLLLEHLEGAAPILATEAMATFRMRKDEAELRLIQLNAEQADEAMRAALAAVRIGATEREVAAAARRAFEGLGADRVNFTIIASGPNGAFPHHATGERAFAEGDAVVLDIGARTQGYNSDITRMAFAGEPGRRYREVHGVVERAVRAALDAVRPGVRACEVDRAARSVIEEAGLGAAFVHRTGHGLGLNGHEAPYITATSETVLDEGMVFSVEPGVYLPGAFGIRLEEIVAVTGRGARLFSRLSREVHVVNA